LIGSIVAKRYARALFAIGQDEGADALKKYGEELKLLSELLEGAPELYRMFRNPIFGGEQKRAVLEQILGKLNLSKMVKNFCFLLAEKDRLAFLPEIQAHYAILLDEAEGIVRGQLTTAFELAGGRQDEIRTMLEKQTNRKVHLDYAVDEDILGGLVLKIGDKVFDASLRAQLDTLKENIKRGE
jgi:F-type H+-transporting ATPase subunit delta